MKTVWAKHIEWSYSYKLEIPKMTPEYVHSTKVLTG